MLDASEVFLPMATGALSLPTSVALFVVISGSGLFRKSAPESIPVALLLCCELLIWPLPRSPLLELGDDERFWSEPEVCLLRSGS